MLVFHQELNISGNKTMNEMNHAIERSRKVVYQPVILGIQTPDTLKGQDTRHHVTTHNQPNNSPSSSTSITPQYTHPPHHAPSPEDVEETRTDPEETQEPELSDPKGKKPKRVKVPWTDEESRILAECWVRVSENMDDGNSQTKDSFWGAVRKQYNSLVSEARRGDQLTGKWSKMSKDIRRFVRIYSKLEESGVSDADIMSHSRKAFKEQTGRQFTFEDAWRVLKDCPKFLSFDGVMSNKRKTPTYQDVFPDEPINQKDDNPNPSPPGRGKSQRSTVEDSARVSSEMLNRELNFSGNKTMDDMDQAIKRPKKVVYQPVVLGMQTANTLKGQVSIKMDSQLLKETGHHVSTHNLPNNSPFTLTSSSVTSQFTEPQHQTPFEEVEETQAEPEPEETQEPKQSDPKGKKPKRVTVPWTDEESRILAECWARVSENVGVGNSDTNDSFWGAVRKQYNSLVSEARRADQITGKWSKMSKDIKRFIGIHSKLAEHCTNGASDADIMSHSRKAFKEQTGRPFNLEEAWLVLKDCPKFLSSESVMSNKRKTPIDQHVFPDEPINQEDDNLNPNPNSNPNHFESLFRDDLIRRPPGRGKSQRSSGLSDAASRLSSEEARQSIVNSANEARHTMIKLAKESETRTMLKCLKLLSQPVSTDLPPDEYQMVMKARAKLKKKYAKAFEDTDDEE
ncbi:uncharacterized protein [Rutidosis leptorrhynchoides]|uniref:uncharacterized protein isoform X2 n=1 Tax=Rutidosis leptorrhynchoides TaxID=125765 RepID=UPI003A9A58BB